ncbi:flippase-like domain-containing protein [Candidatus Micrarchaeota archaeon]|nr:flippase-like domain-containing protein [Candidatus Micrarchaeota archaeon]
MNFRNVLYFIALIALAYALLKIFQAEQALPKLDAFIAAGAIVSYLISIVLWNEAWGQYLKIDFWKSNTIGWSAQFAALTPLSIGNDVLRGYFAKQHGHRFSAGMAASLATKFYKIALALVFSAAGIALLFLRNEELQQWIGLGVVVPVLLLLGLYVITKEGFAGIVNKITFNRIAKGRMIEFSGKMKYYVHAPSGSVLLILITSLAFEFLAFYLCFQAFGVFLEPFTAYLAYALLFFLSKIPLLPQGIVITEIAGVMILRSVAALPLVAAGILLWNVSRVWVPVVMSFLVLSLSKQKLPDSNEMRKWETERH